MSPPRLRGPQGSGAPPECSWRPQVLGFHFGQTSCWKEKTFLPPPPPSSSSCCFSTVMANRCVYRSLELGVHLIGPPLVTQKFWPSPGRRGALHAPPTHSISFLLEATVTAYALCPPAPNTPGRDS